MKKVAIIGIGRVGLPFALHLESLGYEVTGMDKDLSLLQKLGERKMPFMEEGCQELLEKSRVRFTDQLSAVQDVDYVVITVGTPLMSHIETDLSNIETVLRSLVPYLRSKQCLILRSTVAPKTTAYVARFIESQTNFKIGKDLALVFCPERLSEHKALEELKTLPQIIGCEDEMSFEKAEALFEPFKVKIMRTNFLSAELAKLFNNSARYIEFAVANQFAIYANDFNQNIFEILRLTNEDYPRGFAYRPGFTAGTCLRKDFGMINETFSGMDLLLASWKVNEFMPYHLTELALKHGSLHDAHIAILGYTFKRNSDDTRDSLVPKLIRYLERHVPKSIRICEPYLVQDKIGSHQNFDLKICLENADIVFIAVDHHQFREEGAIWNNLKGGAIVLDIWNCLKQDRVVLRK